MTATWLRAWAGLGCGIILGVSIGCGGNRIDAPYPQTGTGRHALAIQKQVGKAALAECPIASLTPDTLRALTPLQARTTLLINPEYQFVQPLALDQTRWLDGHYDWAWQWREGLGFRAQGSWIDTRFEAGRMENYLFQLARERGYIPFAPGVTWRVGAMQECGTWADDRPIRVLLFTLTGPEDVEYQGVSAYWRAFYQSTWISFLGVGSSATAQAEFLTMLRTSR